MSGLQHAVLGMPDGTERAILVGGNGGARPLLHVHGPDGPDADQALLDDLSTDFDVHAPILDGFGSVADVPLVQRQVAEIVAAAGLVSPMLSGHGAGAAVAAELAAAMPGHFSHLFLLSPVGLNPEQRPVSGEGVEHRLGQINCRTTIVWGKQDSTVGILAVLDLARLIPASSIATVPQGTHDMVSTLPAQVARAMRHGLRIR